MYLIRGLKNLRLFTKRFGSEKLVVTIGNFDGLHLGHKKIIDEMQKIATLSNSKVLVIFTEPHAKEFFSLDKDITEQPARISPWRDKFQRLKKEKVDYAFFLKFNKTLQTMNPEIFIEKILASLNISNLMIGDDFRFGQNRKGDYLMLQDWCLRENISLSKLPTFSLENKRVSSTWVREALSANNFDLAESLLDRSYSYEGKVVQGNKLGRTIGFPTANIWLPKNNLPVKGVFSVKIYLDMSEFNGIANIGVRPTVGGTSPVLEVNIFNFKKNLYGKRIKVKFINKIRDEKKFETLDDLKLQISKDVIIAKQQLLDEN
ncbi:MAG: riboflavin biosynthesis protein RibF [Gammaproteobacteria bacterium TMED159]|jgi:riboflavin kinase/FMN adenylyltransferase|nr:MAG: riboflavin biosynthesis protein RibF [Gammaproteobacteria bacterium TMED159]OUW08795.1 MAG: riboflavin biosynthesis protein RibF [Gammaproteobacteria bacterium TMED159]RCL40355.1 MAG: bifunctional riboflavin kinase/FAD synthetase [Gammaproteobacteria bacterium]|tara:strand:+ start:1163 stop:2116 length:954 start_codon:yes stop_codon:yes gene_type:complete